MIWKPCPQEPDVDLLEDLADQDWWDDSPYALRSYVAPAPTDAVVAMVEGNLGYRLPQSYLAMMRRHNGGIPTRTCFPTSTATTWSDDHVELSGIFSVGLERANSLCGDAGSRFWIDTWGYPDLGVYFADCPSAGHDMIAMDYRESGPSAEPRIVHVDQEWDFAVTVLAHSFAEFARGLRHAATFDSE